MCTLEGWQQPLIQKHQPCRYQLTGGWAREPLLEMYVQGAGDHPL